MTLRKFIKRTLIVVLSALLLLCIVSASLFFIVQIPRVQSYLVSETTRALSSKLNTTVSIGNIQFLMLNKFRIHNVFVEDFQGDTLLFAGRTYISIRGISLKNRHINVGTLRIQDAALHLKNDSAGSNIGNIVRKITHDLLDTTTSVSPQKPFEFETRRLVIENTSFRFFSAVDPKPNLDSCMNYANLDIKDIYLDVDDIRFEGDTLYSNIVQLSAKERCGFFLKQFSGKVRLSSTFVEVKKLHVVDNYTNLYAEYYTMEYSEFPDFYDYEEKVRMSANITGNTIVDLKSVSFFAPPLVGKQLTVALSGKAEGTVEHLQGRDMAVTVGQSKFLATFSIHGLPYSERPLFSFDVKDIACTANDILRADSLLNTHQLTTQTALVTQLGDISGEARFTGYAGDFMLECKLNSAVGEILSNISVRPHSDESVSLQGELGCSNLQAGQLLQQQDLGKVSFWGNVEGEIKNEKQFRLNVNLDIPLLEYKGYGHTALKMQGAITESSFDGNLKSDEPDLAFNFNGNLDFAKQPSQYRFHLDVRHADLVKTKLNTRDSVSKIDFSADANFAGDSIDNLIGTLSVNKMEYVSGRGIYKVPAIRVEAKMQNKHKHITLNSDIADARLVARGPLTSIPSTLETLLLYIFPAYKNSLPAQQSPPKTQDFSEEEKNYSFWVRTKNANEFIFNFIPALNIADSSLLRGKFDSNKLELHLSSDSIRWNQLAWNNVNVNIAPQFDTMHQITFDIRHFTVKNLKLDSLTGNVDMYPSGMLLKVNHQSSFAQEDMRAQLNYFPESDTSVAIGVHIFPTKIAVNDSVWDVQASDIVVGSKKTHIRKFRIEHRQQYLQVKGNVSSEEKDTLDMEFQSVSIEPFLKLAKENPQLSGIASGTLSINNLLKDMPLLLANAEVSNIIFDKKQVGTLVVKSFTEDGEKDLNVLAKVVQNNTTLVDAAAIVNEKGILTGSAELNQVNIHYLEPLLTGVISQMSGAVSGKVKIGGKMEHILLNGKLKIENSGLAIDYLNTKYTIADNTAVEVENSNIKLNAVQLSDTKGGKSHFNAEFNNITLPKEFNYKLDVAVQNFYALNTTEFLNSDYYGQGYASGNVQISGSVDYTHINVVGTPEKNTNISIPLGKKAQINTSHLIDFTSFKEEKQAGNAALETKKGNAMDINIDVNLAVTNNANLVLVLNPATGDVINAVGAGDIKMEIHPTRDIFRIFGNYTIENGDYSISIQNVVNRKFSIDKGSYISFNGNMTEAAANMQASYKLRAPVTELLGDTSDRYKKFIPIECKVFITGNLTNPNLRFAIDAPTADIDTRDRMQSQLSTTDNVTTQFMSLLLINRFMYSPEGGGGGLTSQDMGAMGGSTIGEFVTAQIGSLLSKALGTNTSIGFSYNPARGGEADMNISLSTNITDRVSLSGNVDRKQTIANSTEWGGDVDVEVVLDKSGKFRLKMFSHANDQYTEMVQGGNNFGVGLVYQEDFNTFGDLWNALFKKKKSNNPPPLIIIKEKEEE